VLDGSSQDFGARAWCLAGRLVQVLAIVAYEQPVTHADINRIRGVESEGVVASLLVGGFVAEERRFAVRGARCRWSRRLLAACRARLAGRAAASAFG
jgi:enhancing lycopene biosynthesis protein 2